MNFEERAKKLAKELAMEYVRKAGLFSKNDSVHNDMSKYEKMLNNCYNEIISSQSKLENIL